MQTVEQFKYIRCDSHDDWLRQRTSGIGGSEASIILGQNPYKTAKELWEEKTGKKEAEDISDKPYVKYGTFAEKHLRDLFILDFPQYDVWHEENVTLQSTEHPFLQYSPDGLLTDKTTGEKGILEIKTTNILASMQRERWNQQIPQNYYIQVLHGLLVTGYDFVILKAQLKYCFKSEMPKFETRHYLINRKDVEDEIEYLKQEEIDWWNRHMVMKEEPKISLSI